MKVKNYCKECGKLLTHRNMDSFHLEFKDYTVEHCHKCWFKFERSKVARDIKLTKLLEE